MKSGLFHLHTKATESVRQLLMETTLGSNGAQYQLLDTKNKIDELDFPLFLTLQRNEKVLGNVTFCRRKNHWYIRYFAFRKENQSSGKKESRNKGGVIKNELNSFFESTLANGFEGQKFQSFYAYIDPENVKSLWVTEQMGFQKVGEKVTQTFSRSTPRKRLKITHSSNWKIVPEHIKNHFRSMNFFFEDVFFKGEFMYVEDENHEIIAFCKKSIANWRIKRLPGKWGGVLVKIIPFIPVLNRLIQPDSHRFVVPEAVWIKENNPKILSSFFETILFENRLNLIIWWVDVKDELFQKTNKEMKWGLLHKMMGNSPVHIVAKYNDSSFFDESQSIYSAGMDSF